MFKYFALENNAMDLDGSVIVITGGSGCLGQEISRHLLNQGAVTVILDRLDRDLATGTATSFVEVDLLDHQETSRAIGDVAIDFSRIDGLVNCVGMIHSEAFVQFSPQGLVMHNPNTFRSVIDSNLMTMFNATSAFVRELVSRRRRGAIANLSSVSSRGNPGQAAYSAAKAAVDSFTICLARELGPQGIRVNSILPGFMDVRSTHSAMNEEALKSVVRQTPMRKLGPASSVAEMVSECLRNDFLTGALIPVSGGFNP